MTWRAISSRPYIAEGLGCYSVDVEAAEQERNIQHFRDVMRRANDAWVLHCKMHRGVYVQAGQL
jgi:hypothetical protein